MIRPLVSSCSIRFGEDDLLDFAGDGLFPGKEQIFYNLLGNGRGAADEALLFQVVLDGVLDRPDIYTFVCVKAGVLSQYNRPLHLRRNASRLRPGTVLRPDGKGAILPFPVLHLDDHVILAVGQIGNGREKHERSTDIDGVEN
jgi:hypothetical protein